MTPGGRAGAVPTKYYESLRRPEWRDARGYILPADQGDFLTATKFVNILIKAGRHGANARPRRSPSVARAIRRFVCGPRRAGRFGRTCSTCSSRRIIRTTSSTLAVRRFLRTTTRVGPSRCKWGSSSIALLDAFQAPTERLADVDQAARGGVTGRRTPSDTSVSHQINDAAIVVNRLLKAGEEVYWVRDRNWQSANGTGAIFIAAKPSTLPILKTAAAELGLYFHGRHHASVVRDVAVAACPHRVVGSVRRLDAVGPRALAARAVRVPVRSRLSRHARCRQSQGEVRCAAVARWRRSGKRSGWRRLVAGGGSSSRARKTSPRSIGLVLAASQSRRRCRS